MLTRTALAEEIQHIVFGAKAKSKTPAKRKSKQSPRAALGHALRKAIKAIKDSQLEVCPQRGQLVVQHKELNGPFALAADFSGAEPKWTLIDESPSGPRGTRSPKAHGTLRPLEDLLAKVNKGKDVMALVDRLSTVEGFLTKALEAQKAHDHAGRKRNV